MSNRSKKIGIIGAGNMGAALLRAISAGLKTSVYVYDKDRRKMASLKGIKASSSKDLISACDVVILAIKPQDIKSFLQENRDYFGRRHLLITIAAGIPTKFFQKHIKGLRVIRVMPNLPAKVKEAVSFLSKGRYATSKDIELAKKIFSTAGSVIVINEKFLNKVTAVSGSGPGYVYYFMNALYRAALRIGFNKTTAYKMVLDTVKGAVLLAAAGKKDFDVLMREVASRGGTTEAAFNVFEKQKLSSVIENGVKAAARRAMKLAVK